jgi:hypothetical protein
MVPVSEAVAVTFSTIHLFQAAVPRVIDTMLLGHIIHERVWALVRRTQGQPHIQVAEGEDPHYNQGNNTQITPTHSKSDQAFHKIHWLPTFNQ